jgi:hypothetical protein
MPRPPARHSSESWNPFAVTPVQKQMDPGFRRDDDNVMSTHSSEKRKTEMFPFRLFCFLRSVG